jgi:peroxiredoxin
MEKNNETSENRWVEDKLAKLGPLGAWQPDVAGALARFDARRVPAKVGVGKWAWSVAAVAAACVGLSAFPAPRVFAQRCVNACELLFVKSSPGLSFAPDFKLKDAKGANIQLSAYRGRVVLLNFWATWCGGCQVEIPWFMEFESRYKDSGLTVIGVSMDDDGWKSVQPYLEKKKLNYTVGIGNPALAKLYSVEAMPVTYLIDRAGKIAASHVGVVDKEVFESQIVQLLKK